MSVEKYRKKWSNTLIVIVATAIIIGTAFGMGMLHLLTGQGTTGGSEVTASRPTGNGESKQHQKTKAQAGTSLDPMKLFLFKGALFF